MVITGDAMPDLLLKSQLSAVKLNHVASLHPQAPLQQWLEVRVPQTQEPKGLHHPYVSRKGSARNIVDPPEGGAVLPEIDSVLQMLWFERQLLDAGNDPSIQRRFERRSAIEPAACRRRRDSCWPQHEGL
jgi:hypothetical protein